MADTFVKTKKELSAFCGRTFKYGGNIRLAIDTLEAPTSFYQTTYRQQQLLVMKLWGDAVTMVGKQMAGFNENVKKLNASYGVNAPTAMMQQKLESSTGWLERDLAKRRWLETAHPDQKHCVRVPKPELSRQGHS